MFLSTKIPLCITVKLQFNKAKIGNISMKVMKVIIQQYYSAKRVQLK